MKTVVIVVLSFATSVRKNGRLVPVRYGTKKISFFVLPKLSTKTMQETSTPKSALKESLQLLGFYEMILTVHMMRGIKSMGLINVLGAPVGCSYSLLNAGNAESVFAKNVGETDSSCFCRPGSSEWP
jgi:hypothetical protein